MKRYRLFYTLLLLLAAACYDDKGNYNYQDINEVTISGIRSDYNVMMLNDTLRITPVIEMTEGDYRDTARFKYVWFALKSGVRDTAGNHFELNYPVTLGPGDYDFHFKIWDKKYDAIWKTRTSLTVGTLYTRGIMLAGEGTGGNAELQIISMVTDTIICPDILKDSGLPPLQGAIRALHTGTYTQFDSYVKMWVLTRSGAYSIDRLTQKSSEANDFNNLVYSMDDISEPLIPMDIIPQIKDYAGANGGSAQRAVVCSNGDIFVSYMALLGGDFYSNSINREQDNFHVRLKAKPFLMYSVNSMNSFVWYDGDNERFMRYASFILATTSAFSAPLPDRDGEVFPWDQKATGRTLVYSENTRNSDNGSTNGNTFTLMKDKTGAYFIYKFYASATVAKRAFYQIDLTKATGFDQAKFYAFSSRRTLLFYVVGNDLYAYDYNPGNERCVKLPGFGTDEITMVKFDTQIDPTVNPLYIATYNASSKGTLQRYHVETNPDVIEITPMATSKWSGLTKIKDMSWRATR